MKIEAQDTFAIVIDYQERILAAMHEKEELLRRSEILVAGLHALDVPMSCDLGENLRLQLQSIFDILEKGGMKIK